MLLFQGQCFIAIDPNQFEEGFTNRMQTLIDECRNLLNHKTSITQPLFIEPHVLPRQERFLQHYHMLVYVDISHAIFLTKCLKNMSWFFCLFFFTFGEFR
jgi:hypothetical protein